jgi:two-component system, cell cycle response regulator DivK
LPPVCRLQRSWGPMSRLERSCEDGVTRTVLYIEDHYHNRRLVQKVLRANGYEVLLAETGEEGWALLLAHRPPVLLLDIALPGEIDGLEIASRVKADETLCRTWIIALTASAMVGDRERFLQHGCDDYLAKPVDIPELLSRVDQGFSHREVAA